MLYVTINVSYSYDVFPSIIALFIIICRHVYASRYSFQVKLVIEQFTNMKIELIMYLDNPFVCVTYYVTNLLAFNCCDILSLQIRCTFKLPSTYYTVRFIPEITTISR